MLPPACVTPAEQEKHAIRAARACLRGMKFGALFGAATGLLVALSLPQDAVADAESLGLYVIYIPAAMILSAGWWSLSFGMVCQVWVGYVFPESHLGD